MKRPEIEPLPQSEILGTVKPSLFDVGPQAPAPSVFVDDDGVTVQVADPPPPWEVLGVEEDSMSDARKFVKVPDSWELRWINPKTLDQYGWRYWEPVKPSDDRVKVLVSSMHNADNTVRRGGSTGDILAWMPKSWVQKRRLLNQKAAEKLAESARGRFHQTQDDLRSGKYGPYLSAEPGKHPSNTLVDGREIKSRGD